MKTELQVHMIKVNEGNKDKPKEAPTSLTVLDHGKFQMAETFV
jgi:hypothetical protein